MNRAMMFPIHAKWTEKIFNGSKKFELRNILSKHLKEGMKIYLYETKGKIKKASGDLAIELKNKKGKGMKVINGYYYEGHGAIVGEFTVKDIWNISPGHYKHKGIFYIEFDNQTTSSYMINEKEMQEIGYTNQNYAIEITNVIKYEEAPICNTCEEEKGNYHKYNCRKYGMMKQNCIKYVENKNKPTKPIAKEEFINWNKVEKEVKRLIKLNPGWSKKELEEEVLNNKIEGMDYNDYNYSITNVQNSPQAPIYVVEKEVK